MLKRIAMLLNGLNMALFTQAWAWLTARLWKAANNLRVSYFLLSLNVGSQLARIVQKLKQLRAKKTLTDISSKQEPINAKLIATQLGLQAQKIVAPSQQPAPTLSLPKKDPAEKTKSAASHTNASKTAKRRTRKQSTVGGLKSKGHASQRQQPAKSQRNKGK
jgi:hypothetical protein